MLWPASRRAAGKTADDRPDQGVARFVLRRYDLELSAMRNGTPGNLSRTRWRVALARRLGAWLALLQLVAVVGAVVLSGIPQLVAGVTCSCPADDENCPDEKTGRDCPPGCPVCHCADLIVAAPAGDRVVSLPPAMEAGRLIARKRDDQPPVSPAPSSVWRPPRTS